MADIAAGEASAQVRLPLTRQELWSLGFAIVVAHGFFVRMLLSPSGGDAVGYLQAANDIAANGVFSKYAFSEIRTYAYPLFLSVFAPISPATEWPVKFVVFEVQLLLLLAAMFYVRGGIAPRDAAMARLVFCALALNYYLFVYPAETLTESLSLTLALFAAGCWLRLWQDPRLITPLIVGSLVAGFAVMVRPANLAVAFAWTFACAVLWIPQPRRLVRLALIAVALALPAAPQVINNIRHYQTATPLVAVNLGQIQQWFGVQYMKYATGLRPVPVDQVFYENPLARGTNMAREHAAGWYAEYPGRGAATVALHVFNILDQDLLFTYARDLRPWFRVPLGIVNHAAVALGFAGLLLFWRAGFRDRRTLEAAAALSGLLAATCAVYGVAAAEMRFGLVLLAGLFPCAAYALTRLAASARRQQVAAAIGVAIYVAAALALSAWVRSHAPAITAA